LESALITEEPETRRIAHYFHHPMLVYCLCELGKDWHQLTAYDAAGHVLGFHRFEKL
jgi:hypothetical protein